MSTPIAYPTSPGVWTPLDNLYRQMMLAFGGRLQVYGLARQGQKAGQRFPEVFTHQGERRYERIMPSKKSPGFAFFMLDGPARLQSEAGHDHLQVQPLRLVLCYNLTALDASRPEDFGEDLVVELQRDVLQAASVQRWLVPGSLRLVRDDTSIASKYYGLQTASREWHDYPLGWVEVQLEVRWWHSEACDTNAAQNLIANAWQQSGQAEKELFQAQFANELAKTISTAAVETALTADERNDLSKLEAPKTWQSISYATGDDGGTQRGRGGATWDKLATAVEYAGVTSDNRWRNLDGTNAYAAGTDDLQGMTGDVVVDLLSGLLFAPMFPDRDRTWQQGIDYCRNGVWDGYTDFAMLNFAEWSFMADYSRVGALLRFKPFTIADRVWIATTVAASTASAYRLDNLDEFRGRAKTLASASAVPVMYLKDGVVQRLTTFAGGEVFSGTGADVRVQWDGSSAGTIAFQGGSGLVPGVSLAGNINIFEGGTFSPSTPLTSGNYYWLRIRGTSAQLLESTTPNGQYTLLQSLTLSTAFDATTCSDFLGQTFQIAGHNE